jgi:hypothetical protein
MENGELVMLYSYPIHPSVHVNRDSITRLVLFCEYEAMAPRVHLRGVSRISKRPILITTEYR